MAKTSLITGKELWVIANGAPFGSDLLNVMVLAQGATLLSLWLIAARRG